MNNEFLIDVIKVLLVYILILHFFLANANIKISKLEKNTKEYTEIFKGIKQVIDKHKSNKKNGFLK